MENNTWKMLLHDVLCSKKFMDMMNWIHEERKTKDIYPAEEDVFNALKTTSFNDTKVVIMGQDPYPAPGIAHGYAFSVRPECRIPASITNIFREIHDELGCYMPDNGYLVPWAEQGVLLLNRVLTVEKNNGRSHYGIGWEDLTTAIIQALNKHPHTLVFMLWGNKAREIKPYIDTSIHLVLEAAHPSPLAMGKFFGCNHFIQCNDYLKKNGIPEINWQIPNIKEGTI